MRITQVELRHIKMVLVSPFVTSMGTEYDEEHIIVRVDGEGITGWVKALLRGLLTTLMKQCRPPGIFFVIF